jgi:CDP-glucose 4,6-dehydratase
VVGWSRALEIVAVSLRDSAVFLTGHTGFKGSWLTILLSELGAHVTGYALSPPTTPSNFVVSGVERRLRRSVLADVRDRQRLQAALEDCAPDVVFHLAAQPIVVESYANPAETFEINVQGTVNLLEGVRRLKRKCAVIVVTSDKCYENTGQLWPYRETEPMGGSDPYSASKGAAELVVSAYRRSFFSTGEVVRLASARAGNVIGGGDWAGHRIVPDVVRALASGEPVRLRNPKHIRPWQHVLEPIHGYITLAHRLLQPSPQTFCDSWNFGPDEPGHWTVEQLVQSFLGAWGSGYYLVDTDAAAVPEARTLRLDVSKARAVLGWEPKWRVSEAVARTARWYSAHTAGRVDMLNVCLGDVREYMNP